MMVDGQYNEDGYPLVPLDYNTYTDYTYGVNGIKSSSAADAATSHHSVSHVLTLQLP